MTKEELLIMLYRACCLYQEACGRSAPDWIHAVANANLDCLEEAVEIARDDDTYADVIWEDGL